MEQIDAYLNRAIKDVIKELREETDHETKTPAIGGGSGNTYYVFQDLRDKNKGKTVDERIRNLNSALSAQDLG